MSTDDMFAARLKELESAPPESRIDPQRVLAAGRRRRAGRATGVTALVLVAVTGAYTAVAALPGPLGPARPAGGPTPSATTAHATIDPDTGVVGLPFDEYHATAYEQTVMMAAHQLAISRCMADAGFADVYVFTKPDTPPDASSRYGVSSQAMVEQYGYTPPLETATYGTRDDVSTDAGRAARDRCVQIAVDMGFAYEPGDENGIDAPDYGYTQPQDTPEGKALIDELSACLRRHDAPAVEAGSWLIPQGVTAMSHGEQVRIGLIDLDCRQELDFVQRFADVDAQQQQIYIDENLDYFVAVGELRHAALETSYGYLDAAGFRMRPDVPANVRMADGRRSDGMAIVNESDVPITVTIGGVPQSVTVEPGRSGVVPTDDCVGTGGSVSTPDAVIYTFEGGACVAEVLRVGADRTAVLEALFG